MAQHQIQATATVKLYHFTEGVLQSIIEDACEFLDSEQWYNVVGIPYRRGYLLHRPPGTGKSA